MKIVVLDGYPSNPGDLSWDRWKELGVFELYDATSPEQFMERAEGAGALITNKVLINADAIANLPSLKYIGVLATGYNIIDVDAAREHGVAVTNVPAYSSDSVAQLVYAFILAHAQKAQEHSDAVHSGAWQKCRDFSFTLAPLHELAGKTLAIFGLGRIGMKVAEIGHAFGMKIIAYRRNPPATLPEWIHILPKEELFKQADFLTLHCPLTPETKNLVNAEAIAMMKDGAYIVNTSRGPVVDANALAAALRSGKIAGAGIDVLENEPPVDGSPLLDAPNCLVTPHLAWATFEARQRLDEIAFNNLKSFLAGKPVNVVNM